MASVQLRNVTKAWGDVVVSKDINLDIHEGEFVVFVGPSGCGKSTLLRMIAGLETITSGDLLIGDTRMNDIPPAERGVGMVFQSYALYPHLSVAENMSFGLKLAGAKKEVINQRVTQVAEVLQLAHLLERKPKALSGGQRQRVAIGRTLVAEPRVFLLDEPLSNLDAALRVEMRQEIQQLHNTLKNTMIYVTHDQVEAMTLADRIVVLYKGKIEQVGTPLELYNHPANLFVAEFIGTPKINILPAVWRAGALHIADALTFPLSRPLAGMSDGDKVFVAIRPEHIQYQQEGDFAITAKTRLCELQGDSTLVWMDLNGHSLCLKSFQQLSFAPGTSLSLTVQESHLHLFDALGKRVAER